MKVLIVGGTPGMTSVIVSALLGRGHTVRLLSAQAARDAKAWASGVEAFEADLTEPEVVTGGADGCGAALYLSSDAAGDADEARALVQALQAVADEAARAGVRRFVYVSASEEAFDAAPPPPLDEAEAIVRRYPGEWLICRATEVFGPSEGQIALLLKMVRTLPAVPVRGGAKRTSRPLWIEDFAQALAVAVEREGIAGRELELAGPEAVTEDELIDQLASITNRSPAKLTVPELLASLGERLGELLHFGGSSGASHDGTDGLSSGELSAANAPAGDQGNALVDVLGIQPTPLSDGLRKLADALPELLPSQGVGALKHKRYWADIHGCACTAGELFQRFCEKFGEILPIKVGVEPGTPSIIAEGATLTLAMPVRGHIQVRVDEITDKSLTLLTLEGHPLAGAVRFSAEDHGDFVRAEMDVCDRAATRVDQVLMRAFGDLVQNANWKEVLRRVAAASGGTIKGGVRYEAEELGDEDAKKLEERLEELVIKRRREHGGIETARAAAPT